MLGVCFIRPEEVQVLRLPRPGLEAPTDAVVRVTAAGLCGSDLHPYHGREGGLDPGTVMGHELVGVVVEVGPAVTSLRPGDLVFAPFSTCCGGTSSKASATSRADAACFFCDKGLPCRCPHGQLLGWRSGGVGLHGAQAEFVRVPLADGTLVKLPSSVTPEEALLCGDILSTAYFCALNAGVGQSSGGTGGPCASNCSATSCSPAGTSTTVTSDEPVYVVVGCGPVGLLTVLCCAHLGVPQSRLFAVDSVPARLEAATRFGATALDFTKTDVVAAVKAASGGRGADASLEVVGANSALKTAYDVLRHGGILSTIGVNTSETFPFPPAALYDKNVTIRCGRCPVREMIKYTLPMVESGKYRSQLASLISHRLPLTEAPRAYIMFDRKLDNCTKVVFYPTRPAAL